MHLSVINRRGRLTLNMGCIVFWGHRWNGKGKGESLAHTLSLLPSFMIQAIL